MALMHPERDGLLGYSVAVARDRAFVGRRTELKLFRSALAAEPGAPSVLFLHGPGGIGKSSLLRKFSAAAERAGRLVVEVDARTVSPDPVEFEEAAAKALGTPGSVLLVDTFEQARTLEYWLREDFLPRLPSGSVAVIAGRAAPGAQWVADPGWADVLRVFTVRELSRAEAAELLGARGVPAAAREAVLSFAGGNPLALALAAAVAVGAVLDPAGRTPDWSPGPDVIAALLAQLVGDPPSPEHRTALEVCALAYVTSEALLRALFGERAAELFAWLRARPFVETTDSGLCPHDVVREALRADLRWRDPEGFAALFRRMHDHLLEQVRTAPDPRMPQAVGALQFLYSAEESMADTHRFRPEDGVQDLPCTPADAERVVELVGRAEGPESARIARLWLDRYPGAFRVQRCRRTHEVIACSAWLSLTGEEGADFDPLVAAAWEHTWAHGRLREGEFIAVARFHVHPAEYQRPSAVMDLVLWRALGETVRAGRQAWSFVAMRDDGYWDEHMRHCEMSPVPRATAVGDHPYRLFAHDWRAQGAVAWLTGKADALATAGEAGPDAAPRTSGGWLDGIVALSRKEFDAAVRDALRSLRRPQELAVNPLRRSRLVAGTGLGLDTVLERAIDSLAHERGGEKRHRAARMTYVRGTPTQEAAARRLGLPFSTYRRHLREAVERVCEVLWRHELSGTPVPPNASAYLRTESM